MTPRQKLELEQSTIREKIAGVLNAEGDRTDEQRAELAQLTTRAEQLEVELRAAIVADSEPRPVEKREGDGEDREREKLREATSVAEFAAAALAGRAPGAAAAEYRSALEVPETGPTGNVAIPLEMLAPDVEARTETDVDTTANARPWLARLFADTGGEFLGVTRSPVSPGVAAYPALTAGATAAQRARDEATAVGAWTAAASEAKPKRAASAVNIAGADMMRLPGLEDALTRDLRAGLVERMDRMVILGDAGADGTDADIGGLAGATLATAVEITQASKVLGTGWLAALAGMLDGIHAGEPAQIAALVSVPAMTILAASYSLPSNRSELTILEVLRRQGYAVRSRDGIETATAAGDAGGFVARRLGLAGAAVHSVWSAGELIRDMYSGAREGQTRLTLAAYHDFTVVRGSSFVPLSFVA